MVVISDTVEVWGATSVKPTENKDILEWPENMICRNITVLYCFETKYVYVWTVSRLVINYFWKHLDWILHHDP